MADGFENLNAYHTLHQITERSPEGLVDKIRAIKTPIKMISIVGQNGRYTAFFMGPLMKKEMPERRTINGKRSSKRQKESRT